MIKINTLETIYNYIFETIATIVSPIKKSIIKTHCKIHQSINIHALDILKNDKYLEEYKFFNKFISEINEGAVWADQDFKSTIHLYNPYKKKGLYGRKSAMDVGVAYYSKAIDLWRSGFYNKSLFYLGAAVHIIQDMTIPQHANIRLLDNHGQYEQYIKRTYEYVEEFKVKTGSYTLDSMEKYIRFNARAAMKIYNNFKHIKEEEQRFYKIAKCALPLAKRTTAGAMLTFYKDITK